MEGICGEKHSLEDGVSSTRGLFLFGTIMGGSNCKEKLMRRGRRFAERLRRKDGRIMGWREKMGANGVESIAEGEGRMTRSRREKGKKKSFGRKRRKLAWGRKSGDSTFKRGRRIIV